VTASFLDKKIQTEFVKKKITLDFTSESADLLYMNPRLLRFHNRYSTDILGHAAEWLVKAMCYKPEGRGFKSR
jgi:hypothetical protein